MAGVHGPVKILFPHDIQHGGGEGVQGTGRRGPQPFAREGVPFADELPIGVMIEVPAAVFWRNAWPTKSISSPWAPTT
jgi:phosphotransferase system, enzyme I, PtsP